MAHPSKRKGDRFELDVVDALRRAGIEGAERALGAGRRDDRGDIFGIPGMVLQAKNVARMDLPGWMRDAARQAGNDRTDLYAVVHKRHGVADAAQAWVTMPLHVFARWVQQ